MKAKNWSICPRERYLVEHDLIAYSGEFPEAIRIRGAKGEALVAERYPAWTRQQVEIKLMIRGVQRRGFIDFLDEQGGPVEVKSLSARAFDTMKGDPGAFAKGYKYQQEYLMQLAGYCITMNQAGRFLLLDADRGWGEHQIRLPLKTAQQIWGLFAADKVRPNTCQYCPVMQGCHAITKAMKWTMNFEAPV